MKWIKRMFEGIYNSFRIAGKMIIDYVKNAINHAPAVSIMVTSAMGISALMVSTGFPSLITVSWINPTVFTYFIASMIVVGLATLAGNVANGSNGTS